MKNTIFTFLILSFISGCKNEVDKSTHFELIPSSSTGINFANRVTETNDFNAITYRNFYNGGGVAVGDINNDGLPDIYFTSNQESNKLYLNKGKFQFEDITATAGVGGSKEWSTGVSMADVNADGYLDIYVCNSGDLEGANKQNELFINQGNGTFSEEASKYNLHNEGYSTHAAFFDYDQDGDLDCYLLNNSFKDPSRIELYKSMRTKPDLLGGDRLMKNEEGYFVDVSAEAGIYSSEIGFGLGVATGDLNGDHLPDIYISNDFWERDYLYLNQGDGTFKEDLNKRLDYTSVSSMGADIADINADGYPEIFTTDMLAADNYRIQSMVNFDPYHLEDLKYRANYHYQIIQNCLQVNNGDAYFQEMSLMSGVAATDWSWGALFFDFNNNGKRDLFVANGIYKDLMSGDFRDFMANTNLSGKSKGEIDFLSLTAQMPTNPQPNAAYLNHGQLNFSQVSDSLGLGTPSFSNGSAYADLDNDGDLDLVVNNTNSESFIYRNNNGLNNHYLKIKFKGEDNNPYGIGAKVLIKTTSSEQVYENYTNRGFQSSVEPVLTIGLGKESNISSLTVIWPDLTSETLLNVSTDQTLTVEKKNAQSKAPIQPYNHTPVFKNITSSTIEGNITHKENPYNDFNQELLLHRMLSTESPRLIKGDCNGDGKEDLIMLGAKGDYDKLYIQQKDGRFKERRSPALQNDKEFESTCGAFLDADFDGDEDLLIASGGNQIDVDQINFIVRLYLNDGNGNFSVDPTKIPPSLGNFSTLEVCDIDYDGDKDLFLGARAVPGNYGLTPKSFLLRNDRGSWSDISSEAISSLGMVTDATFSDYDKDGYDDLLIVGEWMGVTVIKNNGGKFDFKKELPNSKGWWTRIEPADFNNDGFPEYVLGNWGTNTKFQTPSLHSISMYVNDFDKNGKSEFVINWQAPLDSSSFPFPTKMELTTQLPFLKKKNLKYDQFARMNYGKLFNADQQSGSQVYHLNTLATSTLYNEKGKLILKALPNAAQVAPVFGITTYDFDQDGILDIWLGGNFYDVKPQVGRHAANKGLLLQSTPQNIFKTIPWAMNDLRGQVRDATMVGSKLIIARNNDSLRIYKYE